MARLPSFSKIADLAKLVKQVVKGLTHSVPMEFSGIEHSIEWSMVHCTVDNFNDNIGDNSDNVTMALTKGEHSAVSGAPLVHV